MFRLSAALACVVLSTASLAQQPAPSSKPAEDLPDTPSTSAQIYREATPNGPTAVIDTSKGRITCQFFQREAPLAVANFIELAEGTKDWVDPVSTEKQHDKKFFDGISFHRVIPGFMIQGGDPTGTGMGDPGFYFRDEVTPALLFNQPGRLAMANAGPGPGGRGTNGSQFFVTEVPVPELNGRHTIFGQCDAHSVEVVKAIARVPTNSDDKPLSKVTINKVTIVREGQALPPDPMPPAPAAPTGN